MRGERQELRVPARTMRPLWLDGARIQRRHALLRLDGARIQRRHALLRQDGARIQRRHALLRRDGARIQRRHALLCPDGAGIQRGGRAPLPGRSSHPAKAQDSPSRPPVSNGHRRGRLRGLLDGRSRRRPRLIRSFGEPVEPSPSATPAPRQTQKSAAHTCRTGTGRARPQRAPAPAKSDGASDATPRSGNGDNPWAPPCNGRAPKSTTCPLMIRARSIPAALPDERAHDPPQLGDSVEEPRQRDGREAKPSPLGVVLPESDARS